MNNIGIVGFGFVGRAIASALKDPFLVIDPKHSSVTVDQLLYHNPKVIFLCLPTPTVGGVCDTSLVEEYVELLKDYAGLLVLKSTVPPSCLDKLQKIKRDILYWPEFLRERHAERDVKNPSLIVIGCADPQHEFDKATDLIDFIYNDTHINFSHDKIKVVGLREASLFKYAVNSFLATKVAFMHEFYAWMKHNGEEESWDTISDLLFNEGRIGETHLDVPGEHGLGFAGSCFPKDTLALVDEARRDRYPLTLLESVIKTNNELRKIKCDVKDPDYF